MGDAPAKRHVAAVLHFVSRGQEALLRGSPAAAARYQGVGAGRPRRRRLVSGLPWHQAQLAGTRVREAAAGGYDPARKFSINLLPHIPTPDPTALTQTTGRRGKTPYVPRVELPSQQRLLRQVRL